MNVQTEVAPKNSYLTELARRLITAWPSDGKSARSLGRLLQQNPELETQLRKKIETSKPTEVVELLVDFLEQDPLLQQQLAFALDYAPSRWLLEGEIPVVFESRRKRRRAAGSLDATWEDVQGDGHPRDAYAWARVHRLSGICFSGGGIRSATLNLGVLQGLAELGILGDFDYISSVSGGGYIHEWLAGWIKREDQRLAASEHPDADSGFTAVNDALRPIPFNTEHPFAPDPIRWLRRYSNYLTPQKGLFSADTLVAVAIWLRNTFLNQIVLVSFLFAFVLVPQLLSAWLIAPSVYFGVWRPLSAGFFLLASLVLWLGLDQEYARIRYNQIYRTPAKKRRAAFVGEKGALYFVVLPLLLAAVLLTRTLSQGQFRRQHAMALYLLLLVQLAGMAFAGGAVRAYVTNHGFWFPKRATVKEIVAGKWRHLKAFFGRQGEADATPLDGKRSHKPGWRHRVRNRWISARNRAASGGAHPTVKSAFGSADAPWFKILWHFFVAPMIGVLLCGTAAAFVAMIVFFLGTASLRFPGSDVVLLSHLVHRLPDWRNVPRIPVHLHASKGNESEVLWRVQFTFGPPLLLFVPFTGMVIMAGLVGRNFADWLREWIARVRAWCLLLSLAWMAYVGITLLGPWLVDWFQHQHYYYKTIKWTAVIGWVATTAGGVLAGKSKKASGTPQDTSVALNLLAEGAPHVFIVGLLLLLSVIADHSFRAVHGRGATAALIGLPLLIFAVFGWRVDINEFSMNPFYRNRLTRCYLGATNPRRDPSPLTGLDDRDTQDLEISQLHPDMGYSGPLPIINTTLNISFGEDLAYQERKAASFFFSPVFSGYTVGWTSGKRNMGLHFNGFVPTSHYYCPGGGINVATAAAISGAAASPNWGFHTNPGTAFLLTLFNVRLGWWIANPRRSRNAGCKREQAEKQSKWPSPKFAPIQLASELLGMTDDASAYVYLSDGGHFDNMGLYELVRRRCHRIVICDAECDENYTFEGLGMAIRKCRIDFGVEILLKDLSRLRQNLKSGDCKAHFVIGTIRYPETPEDNSSKEKGEREYKTGTIIYLKSSLTGNAKWEKDPKAVPRDVLALDAEAADILNYKLQHKAFPHDTTGNQWFTESQFESYRRLGQHIVEEVACSNGWQVFANPANPNAGSAQEGGAPQGQAQLTPQGR